METNIVIELEHKIEDLRDFAYRQTLTLDGLIDVIEVGTVQNIVDAVEDIRRREETTAKTFNKHYPSFTGVFTGENNE